MITQFKSYYIKEDWRELKQQMLYGLLFWTKIPLEKFNQNFTSSTDSLARTAPFIGLIIGLFLAMLMIILAVFHIPNGVSAALILITSLLITGGSHEDGLTKCAGTIGKKSIELRLSALNEVKVDTYGVLALAFSLLIRWQAISAMMDISTLLAISGVMAAAILSRTGAMIPFALLRSNDGLENSNISTSYFYIMIIIGFILSSLLLSPVINLAGFLLTSAAFSSMLWFIITWTKQSFGGTVEALRGATQQIIEITILVSCILFHS